jgi:hypothetical protein
MRSDLRALCGSETRILFSSRLRFPKMWGKVISPPKHCPGNNNHLSPLSLPLSLSLPSSLSPELSLSRALSLSPELSASLSLSLYLTLLLQDRGGTLALSPRRCNGRQVTLRIEEASRRGYTGDGRHSRNPISSPIHSDQRSLSLIFEF